jgi:hypothetical protein
VQGRGHLSTGAIFVVNLLGAWTGVCWLIAPVWSLTGNTEKNREAARAVVYAPPEPEPPLPVAPVARPRAHSDWRRQRCRESPTGSRIEEPLKRLLTYPSGAGFPTARHFPPGQET